MRENKRLLSSPIFILCVVAIILLIGYSILVVRSHSLYPGINYVEQRSLYLSQFDTYFNIIGVISAVAAIVYQMIESKNNRIEKENDDKKAHLFEVKKERIKFTAEFIKGFQELIPTVFHLRFIRMGELKYNEKMKIIYEQYIDNPENELSFNYEDMERFLKENGIDEKELNSFVGSSRDDLRMKNKEKFLEIIHNSSYIYDFEYKNSMLTSSIDVILRAVGETEKRKESDGYSEEDFEMDMKMHYGMLEKAYLNSIVTILNELECLTMAVAWDLLAYEQIYHLIVQIYESTVKIFYFEIIVARKNDLINDTVTYQNIEIMYKSLMKTKALFKSKELEGSAQIETLKKQINSISNQMSKEKANMFNESLEIK